MSPIYILHREIKGTYMPMCTVICWVCILVGRGQHWPMSIGGISVPDQPLAQSAPADLPLHLRGCVTPHSSEFPSFNCCLVFEVGVQRNCTGIIHPQSREVPHDLTCLELSWGRMALPRPCSERKASHEFIRKKSVWELQCAKVSSDQWQHSRGSGDMLVCLP